MITQPIREAIVADHPIIPGYVYVVRDGEVIFYVGVSNDPTYRLAQHVGIASARNVYLYPRKKFLQDMEEGKADLSTLPCSPVGACIRSNAPASLEWSFDIIEQADALAVVTRAGLTQQFPRLLAMMERDWSEQRTMVESALIEELQPYLNDRLNAHERPLPSHYQAHRFNPDDNAVDYIKL